MVSSTLETREGSSIKPAQVVEQVIPPLKDYLAELDDPRHAKGIRHPLPAILCLCGVAMIAGAKNPEAIADWWRVRQDLGPFLQLLGFTRDYGPSKSTLYRVLGLVSPAAFEAVLSRWTEAVLAVLPPPCGELEAINLDGKTLRGSKKQGAPNTHLLSALSQRLGITIGQMGVEDKTNEIGAMSAFLTNLVITGRVITTDAFHTQTAMSQTVVDLGGDYVMIVKDNQPTLRADLETLFAEPGAAEFIDDHALKVNKGHGRLESRCLKTSTALNDFIIWPGAQQVFRLDRQTVIQKTGVVREDTVYGLTSLTPDRANSDQLLALVRGHWNIENRSHWVRDVTFGEDGSQVRTGHLPQIMAALRNCTIGLLRLHGFNSIPKGFNFFAARPYDALSAVGCG